MCDTKWCAHGAGLLALSLFGCDGARMTGDAGRTDTGIDAGGTGMDAAGTGMDTAGPDRGGPDTVGPDIVTPTNFDWGTVDVRIADTQPTPTGMTLKVVDEGTPPTLDITLQYPSSTKTFLTDGASITARHSCTDPGLYQIELSSCANPDLSTRTSTTGCVAVVFDYKGGVTGNFIHPTGVRCDIQSGEASIQLPKPLISGPLDSGPPPRDVGVGTFVVACPVAGGPRLRLEGTFAIPIDNLFLLCSGP